MKKIRIKSSFSNLITKNSPMHPGSIPKTNKNNHIRFTDSSDLETLLNNFSNAAGLTSSTTNAANSNDNPTQSKNNETDFEILKVSLVKNRTRKENSFGFELQGDSKWSSQHLIEKVEPNSPADRAGLKCLDKITHVNGILCESYSINNLIDLLEYETDLNENKLSLFVKRSLIKENKVSTRNNHKRSKYY